MKKILILGGSGGLGSQVSKLLESNYLVTSLNSKELDITNFQSCKSFFDGKEFDIVLNFAGVNYDTFIHKIDNENITNINHMIDVNIKGTINIISSCLEQMRKNKYGRIICISSVLAEKTVLGTTVYSSCKSFIDKFIKNVSAENIKYGITANTIQLGYFDGGMTYKIPKENLDLIKNSIGLKRFGKIDELNETINFIINNEYITGINLKIDGGL